MKGDLLLIISIGLPKGREFLTGLALFFIALVRDGLWYFLGGELPSMAKFSPF